MKMKSGRTKPITDQAAASASRYDPLSPTGSRRSSGRRHDVGFRLVDSRASYGVGLETFALGFPIHFDWSWRTLFNKDYEDTCSRIPALLGRHRPSGSNWFRQAEFSVWIGYDF